MWESLTPAHREAPGTQRRVSRMARPRTSGISNTTTHVPEHNEGERAERGLCSPARCLLCRRRGEGLPQLAGEPLPGTGTDTQHSLSFDEHFRRWCLDSKHRSQGLNINSVPGIYVCVPIEYSQHVSGASNTRIPILQRPLRHREVSICLVKVSEPEAAEPGPKAGTLRSLCPRSLGVAPFYSLGGCMRTLVRGGPLSHCPRAEAANRPSAAWTWARESCVLFGL